MSDPDPIVEEVRRVREEYAARFNYDLQAIYRDIQEQQKKSGLKFVSFSRKRTEPPTTEAGVTPTATAPEAAPASQPAGAQ